MYGRRPTYYGGRRRGADVYMTLLLAQLLQQIAQLEYKPPLTLAVIGACFLTFYDEVLPPQLRSLIPSVGKACLQPYSILQNREWRRLFWAAFLHANEYHLYYNSSSMLWKGVQLERRYGTGLFAALLVELLLLSHGLVVALAWLAAYYVPEYQYLYSQQCAIGISAVLFALKVVLNHDSPTYSSIFGITLPTKYMAWAELVLASLFNPNASFLGHLAGILAGLLHVRCLAPALPALARSWRRLRLQARIRMQPGQARFAAAGSTQRGGSTTAGQTGVRSSSAAATPSGGMQQAAGRAAGSPASAGSPAAARQQHASGAQRGSGSVGAQQQQQQPDRGSRLGGCSAAAASDEVLVQQSSSGSRPLSAEELRQRRLQRFG